MDATSLRIFLSLAETENTRDTAAMLGLAQPTVSRTLARLEHEVGLELFSRHGRRLRLSDHGVAFRPDAAAVLDAIDLAERHAAAIAADAQVVRIGFLHSVARWLVPQSVQAFREVYPHARVSLRQGFNVDIYRWLREDAIDIALCTPPPGAADAEWALLAREQLCVAVPIGHPLAARDSVTVAAVEGEDFIAFSRTTELHGIVGGMLDAGGVTPNILFESSEIDTMRGLVAGGLGISILPRPAAGADAGAVYLPIEPATHREIGVGWRQAGRQTPAIRAFLDSVGARV